VFAPAGESLFCFAKKVTKKGDPDCAAPLRGVPVSSMTEAGRG
jgi:hypothetical protein